MAVQLSTLSSLTSDSTLSTGASVDAAEINTHRTNYRNLSNNLLTAARDLEANYASASAPADTPDGKLWYDSTNTVLKARISSAWETLVGLTLTQTLTNKTLTSPTITGPIYTGISSFPDGSAAAPAITNTGDTDTGLFFPAANAVGVAAFGVEPVRITVTTDLTDAVVAILSTEESTSPTTGALTVGDGLGVAGALWVGGLVNVASTLTVTGATTLGALAAAGWPSVWAWLDGQLNTKDFTTADELNEDAAVAANWSEVYDTNSNFVAGSGAGCGRFTPTVAGKYLVVAKATINVWTPSTAASSLQIRKNGATSSGSIFNGSFHLDDSDTDLATAYTHGMFDMNGSTDYISMWLLVLGDSSISVGGSASEDTYMCISRIA